VPWPKAAVRTALKAGWPLDQQTPPSSGCTVGQLPAGPKIVGFLACFATQVAALLKGLVEHTAGQQQQQQQQCRNAYLQQDHLAM
jgi:hypothetical protein